MSKLVDRLLAKNTLETSFNSVPENEIQVMKAMFQMSNIDFDIEGFLKQQIENQKEVAQLQKEAKLTTDPSHQEQLVNKLLDLQMENVKAVAGAMKHLAGPKSTNFSDAEKVEFNRLINAFAATKTMVSLEYKADRLENAGHIDAAKAARKVVNTLSDELKDQVHEIQLDMADIKKTIDEARPELEKHRNNNYLMANVALAVLTLGVGFLLAALVNKVATGNFLFFTKTDSVNRIERLEEQLTAISTASA